MPDDLPPDDPDAFDGVDDDLLTRLRPPPPRTWRDRVDDLTADPPPAGRLALALVALAVVVVVGWRVMAPPPAPPEGDLPLASPVAESGGVPGATGADGTAGALPVGGAPQGPAAAEPAGADPAGTGSAATATEVVVHVLGAVATPGVQRLPTGSRVVDAIEAAGGAAPDADLARVNLAAVLVDGQQVVVLRPGEVPPPVVGATPGAPGAAGGSAGTGAPVDINRASVTELEALPGVGPATAQAIVAHREQNGPFATVDDLIDVRGIGEAKLEQLRDQATV